MRQEDFNWRVFQGFVLSGLILCVRSILKSYISKNKKDGTTWYSILVNEILRWPSRRASGDDCFSGCADYLDDDSGKTRVARNRSIATNSRRALATTISATPHARARNRKGISTGPPLGSVASPKSVANTAATDVAASDKTDFLGRSSVSSDDSVEGSQPGDSIEKPGTPLPPNVGVDVTLGAAISNHNRVIHDLRPDREVSENAGAAEATACLSKQILQGISLWDVISKKNRLRVCGCVRFDNEGKCESLGFVVYRLNQHTLQILHLGVAPCHRRSGIGRTLVRSVREMARRDAMCLSIIVLLTPSTPSEISSGSVSEAQHGTPLAGLMAFWRAVGFRRSEVKGLDDGEICLNIEVRKLGKHQRRLMDARGAALSGGGTTLDWDEVLAEARKNVGSGKTAGAPATIRLPPPQHKVEATESEAPDQHKVEATESEAPDQRINSTMRDSEDVEVEVEEEDDEEQEEEEDDEGEEVEEEEEEEMEEEEQNYEDDDAQEDKDGIEAANENYISAGFKEEVADPSQLRLQHGVIACSNSDLAADLEHFEGSRWKRATQRNVVASTWSPQVLPPQAKPSNADQPTARHEVIVSRSAELEQSVKFRRAEESPETELTERTSTDLVGPGKSHFAVVETPLVKTACDVDDSLSLSPGIADPARHDEWMKKDEMPENDSKTPDVRTVERATVPVRPVTIRSRITTSSSSGNCWKPTLRHMQPLKPIQK